MVQIACYVYYKFYTLFEISITQKFILSACVVLQLFNTIVQYETYLFNDSDFSYVKTLFAVFPIDA